MPAPRSPSLIHFVPLKLAAVLALLAFTGCERKADVAHPRAFEADGLSFRYPGNWTVTAKVKPVATSQLRIITIETPGDGLMMLEEFRPAIAIDLKEMMDGIVNGMGGGLASKTKGVISLEHSRSTPVARPILGAPRDGLRYTFDLAVLDEKVAHEADGFFAALPDRTVLIFMQAPDKDRALVEPGFGLIVDSLAVRAGRPSP